MCCVELKRKDKICKILFSFHIVLIVGLVTDVCQNYPRWKYLLVTPIL